MKGFREHTDTPVKNNLHQNIGRAKHGLIPPNTTNPDRIDLDADRSPHFAFGGGMHHCLGHFVARADINVALSALATRTTDLHVGEGAEWLPDSGNTGVNTLPITFTPRS